MMNPRWSDQMLEDFRVQADPEVDALVEKYLPTKGKHSIGPNGYNQVLLLADQLISKPELALLKSSKLSEELSKLPQELVDYFDPMIAPDWVDAKKIQLGSKVWQDNSPIVLAVLYAASLPSCYQIKNGIPALYNSEKLREKKYIFQRLYETGLMLESTMDDGGITLIEDVNFNHDELLLQALQNLDKQGGWESRGRCCHRTEENADSTLSTEVVNKEIERLRGKPIRYLWGKGYVSAKKVRFLHAAMRYMLTQPNKCCPFGSANNPQTLSEAMSHHESAWDFEQYGYPVNQEDLAYTLLTFGYVIPRGLIHWGVGLSDEEKESFLHLWKVIGYVMGVHPDLLTDDWQEAERLFTLISERQAGYSEAGVLLTEALIGFLQDYLPNIPGMADRLSTALIINQIGLEKASHILPAATIQETFSFWRRPVYAGLGKLARLYFWIRGKLYKGVQPFGGVTVQRIHHASEQLIDSWRSAYLRRPFFVPVNASRWVRQPGYSATYAKNITKWRRRLLNTISTALGFLVLSMFGLAIAVPLGLAQGANVFFYCFGLSALLWTTFAFLMGNRLPKISAARPIP